jgi:hypothetical protein
MRRLLISSAIGLGVLFGALAPTFVPTPASAYYYHHRYYHHRYHHRYYGYRPYYHHRYYRHRALSPPVLLLISPAGAR